ncbi:transcription repressor OFP1 [Arachis hypogaea]|uniref:Transcription repressor n=2 Tax=Arachis hypogaea TaxID=3818 RepID=A0A444ZKP5_ARAHY|nr:transcription repressor OFP1 [Arachis hypogaea]QHO08165.1 Transcription repressor [Arachis hypogaea]RYR14750.1 hypothetical protein Ahy_B04g071437 isoform A [Arachis hypogaea]
MGNYRFKLSDMIPNAWFYKLRDMNKSSSSRKQKSPTPPLPHPPSNKKTQPSSSKPKQQFNNTTTPRKSYYFTRQHTTSPQQQPRKSSSKQRPTIKTSRRTTTPRLSSSSSSSKFLVINVTPTINTTTSDGESEFQAEPEFRTDRVLHTDSNSNSSSLDDIIIDVDNNSISTTKSDINNKHLPLPPILTKPKNQQESRNKNKNATTPCSRRFSVSSAAGARRLRINSPRVSGASFRKLHHQADASHGQRSTTSSAVIDASAGQGRSVSGSFAIVKSSLNPQRDFRESMVEMIVQNNIRSSKDLEDLLACYLTLNSDEYHGLIINVFKQIWFDLTDNNNINYMYQRQE